MIELYSWPTPNGHKIHIALEELNLSYNLHPIDITKGDQFKSDFLKINPNNKIPALVDSDGPNQKPIAIFESGAILIYLAEKTGKLLSEDPIQRITTLQWLMFQMGGVGPMLGQIHHFRHYAPESIPYAIDRYTNEGKRLYKVLDQRLGSHEFLADDYSIADIATFPWIKLWPRQDININEFPNLKRWHDQINNRPAVQKGLKVFE
ncbi:MAG: glutathione S-transferase N-terminal domain-containing protein [Alphaproteobacteria bacterium]|nr:glutathione S-transferase N-terminal domain-containing protein [Alphaproteobacteria bacterium]